jgi:hypothetical protein
MDNLKHVITFWAGNIWPYFEQSRDYSLHTAESRCCTSSCNPRPLFQYWGKHWKSLYPPSIRHTHIEHHILTVSSCGWLAKINLGFAEAQNMAFCLLVKAYKWKCALSNNHDKFKTPRLPSNTVATAYVCLFYLLTLADSISICTETKTSHHYRSSTPCWFRPSSVVLNVARILLLYFIYYILLLYPVRTDATASVV